LISQIVAEFRESFWGGKPLVRTTFVENLLVRLHGGKLDTLLDIFVQQKKHPCGKVFECCVLSVPSLGVAEMKAMDLAQDGDLGT